jgi:hypothetical protein
LLHTTKIIFLPLKLVLKVKIILYLPSKHIMMVKIIFSFLMIFPAPYRNYVQGQIRPSAKKKLLTATHIDHPLTIDGKLNEAQWYAFPEADSFIQIEPSQGMQARFPTVVKVLYDNKNLYIGATCYDSLGRKGVRATELKRDFTIANNDVFGFCIDAFNDKRNNMTFATNPYGPQHDYLSFDAQLTDADWNGLWKVRTSINDSGWIAEFEIPWKTIRYRRNDSVQMWGINFYRLRRLSNEISVWSPYPRSYSFNRMEFAGLLTGIKPPPPSANLQLTPYFLTSYNRLNNTNNQTNKLKQKIGGDIKWAISSNAILDATINTDFAQADADIAVNNITRFSVLFPERRQFFLENASLFSPGLNGTRGSMYVFPFFTRTIGLNNGIPIPIEGGARFVNRSLKENFGAMVIRQGESEGSPLTNFAVARYSKNISKQNRIGAMFTMKSSAGNTVNSSYNNLTGSIDGFFRFDRVNSLNAMLIHSSNSKGGNHGFAGYAQYLYTTNAVQAYWTESIVTKNYQNEMALFQGRM